MGITGFFNDVASIKSSIGNLLDFTSAREVFSLTNPKLSRAIQEVNPALWDQNPGYSFSVTKEDDPFGSISDFATFNFQINPAQIRQDEDFSVNVQPTQSGIAVGNEGFVSKRIVISGTTGIHPKRGFNGYVEFGKMINYIRAYSEYKTSAANADVRLVFKNLKDNEYWFVEPLRFSKNRDASKPFMSMYEITLLVIGKAERKPTIVESFFSDIHNFLDTYIIGPLNDVQQIFQSAQNIILQVEGEVESILLTPINEAIEAIDAISSGISAVSNLPYSFYEDLRDTIREVGDSVSDLFGYGDDSYDSFYQRSAVNRNATPDIADGDSVELMEAFLIAEKTLDIILSTNQLFEEETVDKNSTYEDYFGDTVSVPTPTSTTEQIVESGDTLERIAAKYLGTSDRVLELITLNNLEPPYIDPTGSSTNYRILNPGDKILIPGFDSTESASSNNTNLRESALTQSLSATEKFFGVDLKVDSDFSLIFNNRNDYELSYGRGNAVQALAIKINLEKGGLPVNPELGINIGVGEKAKSTAAEIVRDIRTTILQDSRFSGVDDLSVTRNGSIVEMSIRAIAATTGQSVPVRIALE